MDASHVHWFASLIGDFQRAIAAGDYVPSDAQDSLKCIELITAGYRSASAGGKELSLGAARR
jgi:hypothetical protein